MNYQRFFLLLMMPVFADAAVYKWIDDDGKVHYGDRPTATEPSVEMRIDDSASVPSFGGGDATMTREEKRERLLQSMEEDRLEKQERREKQQAQKQQNRKKCNRYRDKMRHFERARGIYNLDKDGNRVFMSQAQRARATENLQKKINRYCR